MIRLALLWHMHQPYYEDLATGEHILPWVRLHAIKDYWGMVAMLDEFPALRMTFNLVPSMVVQIQAFAEERARDRHLAVGLAPADRLDESEKRFLVQNGFHAQLDRMIRPYPRYAELFRRRSDPLSFSVDDLRDLQVWHKLVWMDPDRLAADARLEALIDKGRGFSEEDKQTLRQIELELLRNVIPAYRSAAERGQIELSTSPFYHPILPLLCNSDVHFRAVPRSALPRGLFRRPDDARTQLARAVDFHTRVFGVPPQGVWPSEGSVSDEVAALVAEAGCRWMATDETILARSLQRHLTARDLYRCYAVGPSDRAVRCLFRDHGLSDLIGFAYQSWDATAAATDFVNKIRDAGRRFGTDSAGGEEPTVAVILDGENAWEHYAGGGRPFLRALYGALAAAPDIKTVTMAEAAAQPAKRLESVFPGSWINGDFYIWAGHADDHRAWAQLRAARDVFERMASQVEPEGRQRAFEELLIAEGSDWFWWYGDDHSSDHDEEFDDLFRRHVRNVYRLLGAAVPDDLYLSNITTAPASREAIRIGARMDPVLDGLVSGFGEWSGAVRLALGAGGGSMHRVTSALVSSVLVGLGREQIYIRLDGESLVQGLRDGEHGLALLLVSPRAERVAINGGPGELRFVMDRVVEVAIPWARVGAAAGGRVSFSVLVTDATGNVVEQHPAAGPVEILLPDEASADAAGWRV
jgi:alpha-amylase/alpha-mannosidase (GH57 family)